MKDRDRLKKALVKLQEHQDVCKTCDAAIYDVTTPCSIASQLSYNVIEIEKRIRLEKK